MKIINKVILVVVIVIGLYVSFLVASDISSIRDEILDFKTEYVPLIFGLVTLGWFIQFARWQLFLNKLEIRVPLKQSISIYISGFSLTVIPGKVGELLKSQLLKTRFGVPISKSAPIVLMEQLYAIIGLVILSFFGIWYFELGAYVLGLFVGILIFGFILISSRKMFEKVLGILKKTKFTTKFVEPLSQSHDSIRKIAFGRITIYASLLSSAFWFTEAVIVYFILTAFGIGDIDILQIIPTYTTSIMLGVLSFLPMGVGVVEGSLASFFSMQGIEMSLSFTIVILIRLFTRWYTVSMGFIMLKISGGLKENVLEKD
tara:strand:+ start:1157 stop:2104 length:948 start_codon:yes stop_codon:yes gene_type:complete